MSDEVNAFSGDSFVSVYRMEDGHELVSVCTMFEVDDEGVYRNYINIIASLTQPDSLTVIDEARVSVYDTY